MANRTRPTIFALLIFLGFNTSLGKSVIAIIAVKVSIVSNVVVELLTMHPLIFIVPSFVNFRILC